MRCGVFGAAVTDSSGAPRGRWKGRQEKMGDERLNLEYAEEGAFLEGSHDVEPGR